MALERKLDITYFIAKKKLAFTKRKPLCDIEECHRVELGAPYKTDNASAIFVNCNM